MFKKLVVGLVMGSVAFKMSAQESQYGPIWSPDGRYLAYTQVDEQTDWEVMIKDEQTGKIKRVTDSKGYDTDITWSPDGKYLAYTSSRSGNRDIYLYDVAKHQETRLVSNAAMDNQPKWSPNGEYLVFLSRRNGLSQLYLYHFATQQTAQLTDLDGHVFHPSWHPDARAVIFDRQIEGKSQIFSVDLASKKVTNLYHGPGSNIAAVLRGSRLIFSSNRSGNWDIIQYDILSGEEKALVATPQNEMKADWHPIKNEITFTQQNSKGQYQLVTLAL
ncbi:TolB family protein [Thalassotalea ganghwensis]